MEIKSQELSVRQSMVILLSCWFLLFFAHLWEAELKLDGMTYAAIARNILLTGDWRIMHYSDYIYPNFFQHPPLAFWVQALFFKVFGVSLYSVKIFNSLIALATLTIVTATCRMILMSVSGGLLASVVLLTSTRWVKFASDFYLDNLLGLFLIVGFFSVALFIRTQNRTKRYLLTAIHGICLAGAVLTKGLVTLVSPAALFCGSLLLLLHNTKSKVARDFFWMGFSGLVVAGIVLLPWLIGGGGSSYFISYWNTSVAYRLTAFQWQDHFVPLKHILTVWLPWWPILVYGTYSLRKTFSQNPLILLAALNAWGIVLGFSLVGHLIEFYLLPFYVFASVVVAWVLKDWEWLMSHRFQLWNGTNKLVFCLALIMATLPLNLHGKRAPDFQSLVQIAMSRCVTDQDKTNQFRRLLMTPKSGYIWHLLALTQWATPWQGHFPTSFPTSAEPDQLLIADESELPSDEEIARQGWIRVPAMLDSRLRLLQPLKNQRCRDLQ